MSEDKSNSKSEKLDTDFLQQLPLLSIELQKQMIELYKEKQDQQIDLEFTKLFYKHKSKTNSALLGSALAVFAFALTAFAIAQKTSLIELATVFAPIAALAGVFLWGFQRKD